MDREQLEERLIPFFKECARQGRPLRAHCLKEAFHGDDSSSYLLEVTADWIDTTDCSSALDFLIDVMWDTAEEQTRAKIFGFVILDKDENLHCLVDQLQSQYGPRELTAQNSLSTISGPGIIA